MTLKGENKVFFNLELDGDSEVRVNAISYGGQHKFYLSVINEEYFNEVYMNLKQVEEFHKRLGDLIKIKIEGGL